jgi:hypothetical protein
MMAHGQTSAAVKGGNLMDKVILDPALREKLNGLDREVELCDETGRTVGHYLPDAVYRKLVLASLKIRLTEEEIEQRRQQKGTGRSLAEIWKRLGQT